MAKSNATEAKRLQAGHGQLALGSPIEQFAAVLGERAHLVEQMGDDTPDAIDAKAAAYRALDTSEEMARFRLMADAWCAAFF